MEVSKEHMKWTYDKPNEDGFYFVRISANLGKEHTNVVHVLTRLNGQHSVFWDGENVSINHERFIKWSGPIKEPI